MQPLPEWRERLLPVIDKLRQTGGNTEDEFLQIGDSLQKFYVKSRETSRLANQLVGLLGDDDYHAMTYALQHMIDEIDEYLHAAQYRGTEILDDLQQVLKHFDAVCEPLEGFQKIYKALRMLGISTKIESARLGELGNGFTVLAGDVEKLSCMVNEKIDAILVQQQQLEQIIIHNLQLGKKNELLQNSELKTILGMTMKSFEGLTELNNRCSGCGEMAGSVADEVAASISEVVSSMQTHDIVRQQMEHVTEALDRLAEELGTIEAIDDGDDSFPVFVSQTGDVCELQMAQVRYAGEGLHNAVVVIIHNLKDIGARQSLLAKEVMTATSTSGTSGSSCLGDLRNGLAGAGAVLNNYAESDRKLIMALEKVAETIAGISGAVGSIEAICEEIDLIALNAQIKAAHTGQDGAALGVLAEAIKRLSLQAGSNADIISQTLSAIININENLVSKAKCKQTALDELVIGLETKVDEIISSIERINVASNVFFADLVNNVEMLNCEINQTTSRITVHDAIEKLTSQVVAELEEIVSQARARVPATNDFCQNLKHMTARYTMQSERFIHDEMVRTHSGQVTDGSVKPPLVLSDTCAESEFGDNVDLF
jgi:methyl-accepting chemotaxis protein